ncbi:MAG: hypothetical protein ACI906_001165 [Candidatus Latescibacterota bacterium]
MYDKILWFLAGAAGTIIIAVVAWPELGPQTVAPIVAPTIVHTADEAEPRTQPIRVEVLNGCGVPQVAARLTRQARALGLDVINEGNATHFGYLHTLVIHRGGDPQQARQVATLLGIPHQIEQQTQNAFRLADVTIVIGRDFERINLFHENR